MKIAPNTVVKLNYELRLNDDPDVVDSSDDGQFNVMIGHGQIIPGLEKALLGLETGANAKVTVQPQDGYGVRDEGKVIGMPRSSLPKDFVVDVGIPIELEDRNGHSFPVWIAGVEGDDVVLDGNHPLAGETLHFSVQVLGVRAATKEELAHGHVLGPGGHHH
ncbi:MAG: peptidylprolyl isomerase [Deltaproteobacteria bacterium]|nr:peptidylprolyl isomerase [Deltaproteobacteria bacterium]